MIWLAIGMLTAAALLPLLAAALGPATTRGRREADLALYRAQLVELEREREAGRLDEAAHAAAVLEVQRRLLAAPDGTATAAPGTRGRGAVLAAAACVPLLALGLYAYASWGFWDMPSVRHAEVAETQRSDAAILETLRTRLAALDPRSEQAREGWLLLANAERSRGQLDRAGEAYRAALAARFEPDVAGQLVQVLLEANRLAAAREVLAAALPLAPEDIGLRFLTGLAAERAGEPAAARAAWSALVASAPEQAPWRAMVQRRLEALP